MMRFQHTQRSDRIGHHGAGMTNDDPLRHRLQHLPSPIEVLGGGNPAHHPPAIGWGGLALAHWGALAGWTRGEVMRRVAFHGVPLPFQYAEGCPKSFECAVCPADTDPERLSFLRRFYPAEYAETVRLAREVMDETAAILERERAALEAGV